MSSCVWVSGTFHKLTTNVLAPASVNARRNPKMPSPICTSPRPVSQAESTTSLVARRSRLETSSAVKIPSSASRGSIPLRLQVLAPARARPERSRGFSTWYVSSHSSRDMLADDFDFFLSVVFFRKNPWVAIMNQPFTPDGQRLLIQFFRCGIVPKRFRKCCKVMQALCYGRMRLTQDFPAHGQSLCVQISCLFVISHSIIDHSQIIQAGGRGQILLF